MVTLSEIVNHLERASFALVRAVESINELIERDPRETDLWTRTIENLTAINSDMGMLNDILRAVLVANEEGQNGPIVQ